jgi:hypothetical protein
LVDSILKFLAVNALVNGLAVALAMPKPEKVKVP